MHSDLIMSTLNDIACRRRNLRQSEWGMTLCVVGLLALLPAAVCTINDCRELVADVILIVDASNDVGLPTWHLSLDAVTSLISAIDHQGTLLGAPSDVNYGLVTVSNMANVSILLGHYDKYDLIQLVESTPYHGGESNTIESSSTSRNNLWSPIFNQPGDRPEGPNIVVVVTSAPTSSSASSALLAAAAAAARDADFRLYAAGVGALSAADDQFLVTLTGGVSERVLHQGETWSQSAALEDLLTHICRPLVQYSQFGAAIPLGPPGPPGPVGATGSSGQRGPVGPQGRPGVAGTTGPIGPIGDDGLPGGSGPPGHLGVEGSRPDGQSGVGGVRGGRGPLGQPGPPGFPGQPSEVVGLRGDRGTVGPPGRIGLPGRVGPQGPIGDHGLVGDRGPTGDRGAEGPTGAVDRPWDGCSPDNHSCHHTCISLGLSYGCGCFHGYRLQADNQTCEDVDECLDNNGGCDNFCHNTEGSRTCSCVRGFTLSPDLRSCLDVDECCQQGSALCVNGTRQKCVNTYGSYVCLNVPSGYLLDPVTGALHPSSALTPSRLDALLVRRGVVVGLLGWVSGLTLLVLLTLLLTWFSDDLLLRILTESQRRQRHLEEKTPREFFLFPKVTSGLGSIERLNRPQHQHTQGATPSAPGELGAKYIDSEGFLTPHDPRDDPARMTSTPNDPLNPLDPPQVAAGQEALEDGTPQEESTQEGSAQEGSAQDDSAPETPARHESMGDDHHQGTIQPGRSKLAMYPSMEFLPEESDYSRPTLSTEL